MDSFEKDDKVRRKAQPSRGDWVEMIVKKTHDASHPGQVQCYWTAENNTRIEEWIDADELELVPSPLPAKQPPKWRDDPNYIDPLGRRGRGSH
jgi:hypothetical protein